MDGLPYRTYVPKRASRPQGSPENAFVRPGNSSHTRTLSRPRSPQSPGSSVPSGQQSPASGRSTPLPTRVSYRPGFQPAGVYRHRTYEFVKIREGSGQGPGNSRLNDVRILRRLDKLVALHFPHPSSSNDDISQPALANALPPSIADIVSRVRTSSFQQSAYIKSEEQSIVNWVDDATVTQCAICDASFSLTVRKHHCRLCGLVVCFLPPEPPRRHRRCSTFIRYEWDDSPLQSDTQTQPSEKPPSGQVVEIDIERAIAAGTPPNSVGQDGVRICIHCLSIIHRQQMRTRSTPVPLSLRLHSALASLQNEIESSLPHLQTLLLSPEAQSNPRALLDARKSVLTRLASHDALAKRLRDLQSASPDEERLTKAMFLAAQTWVSEKMALLKGIGSFEDLQEPTPGRSSSRHRHGASSVNSIPKNTQSEQQDRDRASRLAVLLEQEKLVLGYVEEAKSKRKFEDSLSLQTSLDELRTEIDKVKNEMQ